MGPLARGARGSPGDVGNVSDRQIFGAPGTRLLALRLAAASRRQGIVEGFGGVLRARQRACGARVGNRVAVRAVVGVRVQAVVVDGGATAFASSPPRAPRPPVDAPCGGVGRARGVGEARRGGGQRRARHRRWGGAWADRRRPGRAGADGAVREVPLRGPKVRPDGLHGPRDAAHGTMAPAEPLPGSVGCLLGEKIFNSTNQSSPFCRVWRSLAIERRRLHHPWRDPVTSSRPSWESPDQFRGVTPGADGDELLPTVTPLGKGRPRRPEGSLQNTHTQEVRVVGAARGPHISREDRALRVVS